MATQLATFWGITINNPTETDYALVHQGYPDYLRALIHTTEVGKDGTPHIQGWIKLQKQQRMSFVKKLFPRANLKPLQREEYELNTRRYVQKNDDTTAGAHIQTFNDPIPDVVKLIEQICLTYVQDVLGPDNGTMNTNREQERVKQIVNDNARLVMFFRRTEKRMVQEKPQLAKLFVSPVYAKIKREFLPEIFSHVCSKYHAEQDDEGSTQEDSESETEECATDGDEHGEEFDDSPESGSQVTDSESSRD